MPGWRNLGLSFPFFHPPVFVRGLPSAETDTEVVHLPPADIEGEHYRGGIAEVWLGGCGRPAAATSTASPQEFVLLPVVEVEV